jgi:tetratricopeptide (TPR) repeat protein
MPLSQIRDAALVSAFPSQESLDRWLAAAIGENRRFLNKALEHSLRALRQCPLQGEGYVYLAQLSFLDLAHPRETKELIRQALRVRPRSSAVILAASREAALHGNLTATIGFWKRAFHHDANLQTPIIETIGPLVSPQFCLEELQPDRHGLNRLFTYYRRMGRAEDARLVARRYAQTLEQDARAADNATGLRLFENAYDVYRFAGCAPRALSCLEQAVARKPDDFALHYELANAYMSLNQIDDAMRELHWCLNRRPNDPKLRQLLNTASRSPHRLHRGISSIPHQE